MLPQEELPILEALVNIKHRLTALKKDTSTFVRSKDVMSIYQAVAREVTKLNEVRDRQAHEGMISSSSAIASDSSDASNVAPRSRSTSNAGKVRAKVAGQSAEDADSLRRRLSNISSASSSATARASSQDNPAASSGRDMTASPVEEDDEEELLSESASGASSRVASVLSTPAEERCAQLEAWQSRSGEDKNIGTPTTSTPALSPQPTAAAYTGSDPAMHHHSYHPSQQPSATTPGVDVDVDVDHDLSQAMQAQHISQIDVKPPSETNRVDQVLNDVFSLLSLFFLTIGKTKESPGIYVQIASMRQLLDHMNESGIYTQADLQPFAHRLQVLKTIIKRDKEEGKHPAAIVKLMMRKLEDSERLLQTLLKSLSVLSVELVPVHQRLVSIRRQLVALAAQHKPSKADVKPLVEELRKIDSSRVDGKFLGPGGSSVPTGQAILVGLLEECFEICQDIRARDGAENVASPLRPIWERLTEMRAQLERLQLTHRWTLRETDLYNYAQSLREIDQMRVDGSFMDAEGNKAQGQYVLLYLLRRCHGLIYRLIAESEPISEELMPIANKLSTVKKCLNEVLKYGGPFSARDLYPYHLALHQIDSLRRDGKFLSEDGSIPEGQAILVAQLSEAHEILEMLKESMGDEDEDDEDESEEEEEESDEEEQDMSAPTEARTLPVHAAQAA
ncbi:hypothetical protein QFC22_000919 [Naganishia vaughanmartiniae]|uniref:Uncharacterized protein n=1 Tax=Naganishia vaughanmartiniae TaxID=1424756 RepID=A0ACC2XL81_9TREE|nr:hypothetical protein QFC22_000919 [Naganishia vaughanmartiniae]